MSEREQIGPPQKFIPPSVVEQHRVDELIRGIPKEKRQEIRILDSRHRSSEEIVQETQCSLEQISSFLGRIHDRQENRKKNKKYRMENKLKRAQKQAFENSRAALEPRY